MIAVAGDVARAALLHLSRCMRIAVPDRFATTVDVPCAFHLVGGRCRAPIEVRRKFAGGELRRGGCRESTAAQHRCTAERDTELQELATFHRATSYGRDMELSNLARDATRIVEEHDGCKCARTIARRPQRTRWLVGIFPLPPRAPRLTGSVLVCATYANIPALSTGKYQRWYICPMRRQTAIRDTPTT
jgi:hypothetical protein